MARVVWIASAPDTAFKLRDKLKDTGKVFQDRLCNLNSVAETKQIVRECEAKGLDLQEVLSDQILGVALVEPAFSWDALRELSPEELVQYHFFQALHDADCDLHGLLIFFAIRAHLILPESMPVQRVGRRESRNFFAPMQEGQLQRLLDLLEASQVAVPPWLADGIEKGMAETLVFLPKPFAVLAAMGTWSKFCVCDMQWSSFKGWGIGACPAIWRPDELPNERFPAPSIENIVRPEVASGFSQQLKSIFNGVESEIRRDHSEEMAKQMLVIAASLERHVAGMRAAYGAESAVLRAGKDTYNVFYLLHCCLLCNLLRADKSLEEAVKHACRVVLPHHIQVVVLDMVDNKRRRMPSAATVSRLRLKVDVAWMLLSRRKLEAMMASGIVANCMVDSSPQGGHDYELMHLTVHCKTDLSQMHVDMLALERRAQLSVHDRMNTLEVEQELMERVRKCFHTLFTPPAVLLGVGQGRSTLSLKFHAVIHALYLIAGPSKNLEKFTKSVCSWVSDLGTESGFAHIGKIPFRTLMPYVTDSETQKLGTWGDEVDLSLDHPGGADEEAFVNCEGSVAIPGVLHILHNCFAGLADSMQEFSTIVENLKQVANLLRQPETKERLLSACFSDPIGQGLSPDIKAFSGHVYEERWGHVSDCALQMVGCEKALRHMWSLEKYVDPTSQGERHAERKTYSVNLEVADSAIGDPFFWAYVQMLSILAGVQLRLTSWVEGCPCHWDLTQDRLAEVPSELRSLCDTCPLKGMRGSDIASGKFQTILQDLWEINAAQLVMNMPPSISQAERLAIISDFENGRSHVMFQMALKMSHWQTFPWASFGASSQDEEKSKQILEQTLAPIQEYNV